MSNETNKVVSVEFVAKNASDFASKLNEILVTYGKLSRALPDVTSSIKNSGLSLAQQAANLDLVSKAADASTTRLMALAKQEEITKKGVDGMLDSLREQARIQSLSASATKGPSSQVEEQSFARLIEEQKQYLALQKQIQETDLANATARGQQMAAEQKQIEETDLLRAKAAVTPQTMTSTQMVDQAKMAAEAQAAFTARVKEASDALMAEGRTAEETAAMLKQLGISQGTVNEAMGVASESQQNVMRDARGGRDALFAFGLALNLIISELGSSLPASAKTAASSIKIVADAMLAGAYIGGAAGAALGTAAGVLISLGAAALTVSPEIKALNDQLDKLAHKDDAAQGLANLAHVSYDTATAVLDYVKKNDQLAESFQKQVQAAQPAIPVLQGVGDAVRALHQDQTDLVNTLRNNLPVYNAYLNTLESLGPRLSQVNAYNEAYAQALRDGKGAVQAAIEGSRAMDAAVVAQAQHQKDLTDALNATTRALAAQAEADKLTKIASKFAVDLQKINQTSENDILAADQEYQNKIAEIDQNGVDARVAIANRLANQLRDINSQLQDDLASAAQDMADSIAEAIANEADRAAQLFADFQAAIADAEEVANEKRAQYAQDYADKRVTIEQDYQDKIQKIQEDYSASLFEIVAKDDAKGLVMARLKREKELADAQKARDKQDADAQKAYEKQQRDLDAALKRQEEKLQDNYEKQKAALEKALDKEIEKIKDSYEKRIAALEAAAEKQRQKAITSAGEELTAQGIAQKKAEDSAKASLDARVAQITQFNLDKTNALIDGLINDQTVSEEGARPLFSGHTSWLPIPHATRKPVAYYKFVSSDILD